MTQTNDMEQQFLNDIASARPTLVVFGRPDKDESPAIVEAVREKLGDRANVLSVDGTEYAALRTAYKVDTYPTFIIFKDGTEAWRDSGNKGYGELVDMLRRFI